MRASVALLCFVPLLVAACDGYLTDDPPCTGVACTDGGVDATFPDDGAAHPDVVVADATAHDASDAGHDANADADAGKEEDAGDGGDANADVDAADASWTGQTGIVGTHVVAGWHHTCVLLEDQTVKCWGDPTEGELGVGDAGAVDGSTPQVVPGLTGVVALGASSNAHHTCAVIEDGTVECWGGNDNESIGPDSGVGDFAFSPTLVSGIGPMRDVGVSLNSSCAALKDNSGLQCWGVWSWSFPWHEVALITGFDAGPVTSFNGTSTSYCAAYGDGGVGCWGDDDNDVFGASGLAPRSTPYDVPGVTGVVQVAAGGTSHACAVRNDGSVMCWGKNGFGECGTGSTSATAPPTVVQNTGFVVQVAVGEEHTCVRRRDGTVACWGNNGDARCGTVGPPSFLTPRTVPGVEHATDLAAGVWHTCAVTDGSKVVCWGNDAEGQLGNGNVEQSSGPVQVKL
jgi:alpha-tubulin suppressor-like RCC1 family protein